MHFPQTSVSPSALQAPPYYLGRGENQMPALELPLQLLLLLLRLRELGLLLVLFALGERKQITMQNLVINSRYEEIEHTYLLTSSPSEINILFVLEEFPSHALDCGVPPL